MEETKEVKAEVKQESKSEDKTLARLNWIYKNRLVFNTTAELEAFWNVKFGNNVIERAFPKPEERRRAYLDLAEKVLEITAPDEIKLNDLMDCKDEAINIFASFARKEDKESIAREIIQKVLYPNRWSEKNRGKRKNGPFKNIDNCNLLTVTILILLLLKIFNKDRVQESDNIEKEFDKVIDIIASAVKYDEEEEDNGEEEEEELVPDDVDKEHSLIDDYPRLAEAKSLPSTEKTRLRLLLYVYDTICRTKLLSNPVISFDMSTKLMDNLKNLDICGFWGFNREDNTQKFFEIEETTIPGYFFFTIYMVKGNANKEYIGAEEPFSVEYERYDVLIYQYGDNDYTFHFEKPHIMLDYLKVKKKSLKSSNMANYHVKITDIINIKELKLHLNVDDHEEKHTFKGKKSNPWLRNATLCRCKTKDIINRHQKDIEDAIDRDVFIDKFKEYQYEICSDNITRAITREYLYLCAENEGEYFKVPKKVHESLSQYGIETRIYIIKVKGKSYIGFPNSQLFIRISPISLKKWGIERVKSIVE